MTLSFNLAPGAALGEAATPSTKRKTSSGCPPASRVSFGGVAAFERALASEPLLILVVITVYIVLGVYESYVHPLTILSSLPSAGVGALVLLLLTGTDFSIIALIGLVLLIGIVKKNAIMMIDFALEAERKEHKQPLEAIREASLLRFRPIMMTTLAALSAASRSRSARERSELPSPWHRHRRRPAREPAADALPRPRHLSLVRPSRPAHRGASPTAGNDRA